MTKVAKSLLTGQATVYSEHSLLITCQPAEPVAPESLITLMNSKLTAQGYDAYVDQVKIIQGWADTNVQAHLWIAGESPVDVALALAILFICASVVLTVYIIASTAQTIIEHFWPQAKFYQVDAQGNQIVVGSLAEYITCQQATHPNEYVCGYCGQVFSTLEARDAHQKTCPWREGVPGQLPSWAGTVIMVAGAGVVIVGLWALTKIFRR